MAYPRSTIHHDSRCWGKSGGVPLEKSILGQRAKSHFRFPDVGFSTSLWYLLPIAMCVHTLSSRQQTNDVINAVCNHVHLQMGQMGVQYLNLAASLIYHRGMIYIRRIDNIHQLLEHLKRILEAFTNTCRGSIGLNRPRVILKFPMYIKSSVPYPTYKLCQLERLNNRLSSAFH